MAFPSSDGNPFKKKGLLHKKSKQDMSEKHMFGRRSGKHGSDFMIGKKKHKGSKIDTMKSSSISPSIDEFDNMLAKAAAGGNTSKKKNSRFSG